MHLAQLVEGFLGRPAEGLGDHAGMGPGPVAQPAVAFQQAVYQALDDVRVGRGEALVDHQDVGDHQQVAVGHQHLRRADRFGDHLIGARRPADATVQALLAGQFGGVGIAGDKGVLVEHQTQLVRSRTAVQIAQHPDRHAGFGRQVADKELALVELGGAEHLALELVDAGDGAVHHHLVGATGEGDLRRHRYLELPAEHGQHIGGSGHRCHLTVVQRRPLLALALVQAHLETVLLGEERVGVGRQTAVGDDQAAVTGVLAHVDVDDVVLHLVGRGRLQGRRTADRLHRRRP
ncbi:hypothetical protein FQZ97_796770 [compost metagenome]